MSVDITLVRKLCRIMLMPDKGNHFSQLGIEYVSLDTQGVVLSLPYSNKLVGNPYDGVVHGGVITTLLDTCCGVAAMTALPDLGFAPTLDLRIDYMKPAVAQKTVYAQAEVYRCTANVIFARGRAYQEEGRPVAHCVANFTCLEEEALKAFRRQILPVLQAMGEEHGR